MTLDTLLSYSGGVFGLIILVLDIVAILEVLQSNRTPGGKVGWSLLIFVFPVVGLIAYFFLSGRTSHGRYELVP